LFTFGRNGLANYDRIENERRARMSVMEEQYKGHVLRVTIERDKGAYPWNPICRILDGEGRELIKQLDWPIGYNTPEQAEKAGLIISKKWIDAGKPAPLSPDSRQLTPRS
jgi:hypothetical protein